ncbi:MAG TPA: rhodanese-like domain-containing protein [Microbacterium sp.]|uniref:rhodanese-like domain-containing protein n=1 Tax=Microbacterium sp. TaxID=51671 RepID=UPI002BAB8446|nr:rhodanese-like domain-containing protein [Microbacterium sp.]HWI31206.1 rhodanese-like domain-containing protein [Microbacterium sp.]
MTSTLPHATAQTDASPIQAAEFFGRRLRFETDASDVYTAQQAGEAFVLLDSRSEAAWAQGHAAGAIHMPTREIAERAQRELPGGVPVVVYCWSPGCNGGVKAALELSLLGYSVKEMIGGFEYWAREGYPIEDGSGVHRREVDPLTGPRRASAASCAC